MILEIRSSVLETPFLVYSIALYESSVAESLGSENKAYFIHDHLSAHICFQSSYLLISSS